MATNWCIQKGVVCDRVAASGYCAQTACTRVFQTNEPRQTNAERIRAMSDKELRRFFAKVVDCVGCPPSNPEECIDDCEKCWEIYLETSAEED